MRAPVVLFGFNRPQLLARVLERVVAARPPVLVLIADGPRASRSEDLASCAEVRRLFDSVTIDGVVEREYSATNLGAGRRIASGLDWTFERHEEAIVLEDDIVPDPSFFPFCDELLERYRNDERVAMVSGCNFQRGRRRGDASYYFSCGVGTWGWATWRRAWREFDFAMSAWPEIRASDGLARVWPRRDIVDYWRERFDDTHRGRDDVWDYQWAFAMWRRQRLQAAPNVNLASHIGCSAEATHLTQFDERVCALPLEAMRFPLVHPPAVERVLDADLEEFDAIYASS